MRYARAVGRPPGSPLPAIAQLGMFLLRPVQFIERARRRYGDIFTVRSPIFGNEIVVSRPDTVRSVLRADPDVFRAGEANQSLGVLVGSASVLLLDGSRHRRQRRLLMPPFHGDRMRGYTDVMREQTLRVIERWRPGEITSVQPAMRRITLEVILRTVFGMDEDESIGQLRDHLQVLLEAPTSALGMLPLIPALQRDLGPLWPYGQFVRLRDEADAMIHRQIERARRQTDDRQDILSLLLAAKDEEGAPMTDAELRDELMTLLVAGHETTATSLGWAFEQILLRPAVHDRIVEEARDAIGDDVITADNVGQLRYLDATIKEVLRVRPIIPFFGRKLKASTTVQGYDVEADDMVVPCSWLSIATPQSTPSRMRSDPSASSTPSRIPTRGSRSAGVDAAALAWRSRFTK